MDRMDLMDGVDSEGEAPQLAARVWRTTGGDLVRLLSPPLLLSSSPPLSLLLSPLSVQI
jgi:hypothetical protein